MMFERSVFRYAGLHIAWAALFAGAWPALAQDIPIPGQLSSSATADFDGVPRHDPFTWCGNCFASVTVAAGQKVQVIATEQFLGYIAETSDVGVDICYQHGAGPIVAAGGGQAAPIQVAVPLGQLSVPVTLPAILTNLPAGTYHVGMCSSLLDGPVVFPVGMRVTALVFTTTYQ